MFRSTKTYGHERGFSCVFRQPRAESHCRFLHGYSLSFKFTFACVERDSNGWVMDFGGLKPIKEWLEHTFDHTTILDARDPALMDFRVLAERGVVDLRVFHNGVGCEAFAHHAGIYVQQWLNDNPRNKLSRSLWLHSCEVAEHGSNSAIWIQEF